MVVMALHNSSEWMVGMDARSLLQVQEDSIDKVFAS